MGNSCPPCQCNTDTDRPYYDLMNATLKQMQCMPEDTSMQMTPKQNQDFDLHEEAPDGVDGCPHENRLSECKDGEQWIIGVHAKIVRRETT